MVVRDVNAEKEYDVVVNVDSSTTTTKAVAQDINSYVKAGGIGLQKSIFNAFDTFFQEFHAK